MCESGSVKWASLEKVENCCPLLIKTAEKSLMDLGTAKQLGLDQDLNQD